MSFNYHSIKDRFILTNIQLGNTFLVWMQNENEQVKRKIFNRETKGIQTKILIKIYSFKRINEFNF